MNTAQVCAHRQRTIIQQAGSVHFFGRFELIDEPGQQFCMGCVSTHRYRATLTLGIMTHTVGTHCGAQAGDHTVAGHSIRKHACCIDLHCSDHQVVHDFDFRDAFQRRPGLSDSLLGRFLVDRKPLFFFLQTNFDLANRLQIFVQFCLVSLVQLSINGFCVVQNSIQHAALFGQSLLPKFKRRIVIGKQFVERGDGCVDPRDRFA